MGAHASLALARRLLANGAASRAVRLLQADLAGGGPGDADHLLLLARALIAEGRDADAAPIVGASLGMPLADMSSEALRIALAAHIRSVSGDPAGADRLARRAIRVAGSTPTEDARRATRIAYEVVSRAAVHRNDLGGAVAAAERASEAAALLEPTEVEAAAINEAFVRMQADEFGAAREVLARVPTREPGALTVFEARRRLTLGAIDFHAGEWTRAAQLLDSRPMRAAGIEVGDILWGISTGLLAVLHVHADRLDEATALLAEGTAVLATGPRPWSLWAALLVAEARGDWAAVASLVDRLLATMSNLRGPHRFRVVGPDLVRLLRRLDDRARAEEIPAQLEALAGPGSVISVIAAARLCRGLLDDERDSLREAAAGFRAGGRPLEEAMALEALSIIDLRVNQGEARDAGRRALALYEALGAHRDERRLGKTLREAGVATGRTGPRSGQAVGWSALSATERAVAGLVAEGLTNAEIGARLAISTRTVESHVSHVLNKLSLPSRAGIAAAATRAAAGRE